MSNKWSWGALVPRSLLSRMILLLLLAILLSQTILTGIWMQQIQKRELEGMISTTRNLALSAASTVNFFKSLPLQYRHIALDQLRNMGGSRFFVSLNEEEIHINAIPESERKTLVLQEVQGVLTRKLSDAMAIKVDFSRPDDLHVFNNDTLLADPPAAPARQGGGQSRQGYRPAFAQRGRGVGNRGGHPRLQHHAAPHSPLYRR